MHGGPPPRHGAPGDLTLFGHPRARPRLAPRLGFAGAQGGLGGRRRLQVVLPGLGLQLRQETLEELLDLVVGQHRLRAPPGAQRQQRQEAAKQGRPAHGRHGRACVGGRGAGGPGDEGRETLGRGGRGVSRGRGLRGRRRAPGRSGREDPGWGERVPGRAVDRREWGAQGWPGASAALVAAGRSGPAWRAPARTASPKLQWRPGRGRRGFRSRLPPPLGKEEEEEEPGVDGGAAGAGGGGAAICPGAARLALSGAVSGAGVPGPEACA